MGELFDFGKALEKLKAGKKVGRLGWNGKGMWVKLLEPQPVIIPGGASTGGNLHTGINRFFVIKNPNGEFNTWVPSVSDALAEDWEEVV